MSRGKEFEEQVEKVLLQYQIAGVLRARKVDPPTRWVMGRLIPQANPFLDFVGVWTERAGRSVFFEAKETAEPRLAIGGNGITATQRDSLVLWGLAGAVTFVLWRLRGHTFFLPGPLVASIEKERKHVRPDDCLELKPANEIQRPGRYQRLCRIEFCFLDAMRRTWPCKSNEQSSQ